MQKDLALRARFELAILVNSQEPNLIRTCRNLEQAEGNQQVAMKRDESLSPSLCTFRSRLAAPIQFHSGQEFHPRR